MDSAASTAAFDSRVHAPEEDGNRSTFARRDGTSSQHGVSFQYQVAALLLARALARDPGARVGAEHKHAGVFDDVSVHVRPAPGRAPVLLLLQLKHKSDKSNAPRVGSQALRGDSGSFAVRKYYRSYVSEVDPRRLGAEPTDTYYVLFTNAALPEGALAEAPVGPGALPRAAARLLHTGCGRGQPRVLAPHADHLAGEARGPEFQARFLWLGSQASDVELLELLAQELTQHMRRVPGDVAARARALVRAVEEWYEATGDVRYLTADWEPWRRLVVHADADAPLLRELRFHDAEIRRLGAAVAGVAAGGALLLASDTADEEVRAAKMAQLAAERPLLVARVGVGADVEVALGLWERGWCRELALLLPAEDHTREEEGEGEGALGERLLKALALRTPPSRPDDAHGRALVILAPPVAPGRPEPRLVALLRARLSARGLWVEAGDSVAFRLLAPAARAAALRRPALFQGRACALADLRQEHVLDAALRGDALAQMLRSERPLRVGRPLNQPAEGELYVPRRLQKGVAVRAAALRAPGLRDVFVVKEASRDALQALVPPAERVQPLDRHAPDTRFVACRKMGWAKFRQFADQHPGRRCHFLKMVDGTLMWRQSAGADSDDGENPLLGFLEAEGEELENNAAFLKGCVSCTPFEEELAAAGVRTVLVSGEPGAGKSEALRRVGRWLAERRAGDWVVRLSLADHADALAAGSGECAATAAEALLRRAAGVADPAHAPGPAPTADDLLAGALLRDRLWETGRLRVLVDAFDEISPDYTETVVAILKALQDSCVSSLWVSSREVMEDRLEAELRVRAFSLKPLSLADQEQFWVEYWSGPLGSTLPKETLKRKAKQLLHYLGGRFRSQLRLNIPLHTNIMANLFGRGFLSGNCEESLRHKDVLYVYDKFVEMKFDIYCKEKASIVANSVVIKNLLNALHRDFMEKHKMCGLLESGIFDFLHPKVKQDICKNTEGFIADIQKGVEKTGIIVGVFCGKPRFIHRTFAEYFTARWIAEHHAENPGILDVLLERRFKSLKSVTDQLMSKQHELHRCVLNEDIDCLKEILLKNYVDIDAVDNGGRTALILAVQKNSEVGYEMSRHLLKKGVAVLGDREIYCAAKSQAWNNVKLLLDNGITLTNSVVRNEDVQNVLESAFSQNIITEEDKGVKDLDLNWNIFSNGRSILHLAIQCGAQESTDTLLEMGADPQSKDRQSNSPLHYAVLRHDEELVDKLLSRGAFIQQNIQGETPLFLACSLGLVPVVRKLLGHGASVNARSKTGSTLLHASVDHLDVMEILLQYEIDVDATDCRGFTVLHEATRRKKVDLISLLLRRGANVNCLNLQSQTPLLIAVANECIPSATLLLKAGANVSDVTSSGNTALHIAVGKKNILMTTLLLRNGADVNIQNHKGDSTVDLSRKLDVKKIQIVINSQTHKRTSHKSDEEKIVNGHPKTDESPCQKGYWEEEEEDEVDAKKKRDLAQSLRSSQPVWSPDQAASPEAAALLSAIKRRNMRDVKAILVSTSKDASLWSARDSAGDSALHLAARTWTAEVVSLLLVHAPPEALAARNAAGDTAAHVAAARRLHSISLSLLASGADPCARNALGDTPLHVACRLAVYPQVRFVTPRLPAAALLARNDAGDSVLHLALALGESKEEAQLLEPPPGAARATLLILYESKDVVSRWEAEGAGAGAQRRSSRPSSRAQLVKTLLGAWPAGAGAGAGAALRAANARGDTPLHVAARGRVLGAAGAAFRARSAWGAGVLRALLEHEHDVAAANAEGDTVLHLACRNAGDPAAVGVLLESKGADAALAAANARGDTPLHDAAAAAHGATVDAVRALVEAGADPSRANAAGETPADVAERANNPRVSAYLREVLSASRSRPAARRRDSLAERVQLREADDAGLSRPAARRGGSLEEWQVLREGLPRPVTGNGVSTAEWNAPQVKLKTDLAVVPTIPSLQTVGIFCRHGMGLPSAGSEIMAGRGPSQEEVKEKMHVSTARREEQAVPFVSNVGISPQHPMQTFPAGSGMSAGPVPYQEKVKDVRYISVANSKMQSMPFAQNVRISSQHAMPSVAVGNGKSVGKAPYQGKVKDKRYVSVASSEVHTMPSVQNVGISEQYAVGPPSAGSQMSMGMVLYQKEATSHMQPRLDTVIPSGEHQVWGELPNFNALLDNNGDPLFMGTQPNTTEYSSMYFNADGDVQGSQAQLHGEFYQYQSPMWNVNEPDKYVPQTQVSYHVPPPNPPQEWLTSWPQNGIQHFGDETYTTQNTVNSQLAYSPPFSHIHSQIQHTPFSHVNVPLRNAPYMEHYQ